MIFKEDSKKHLKSLEWFENNKNLTCELVKWSELKYYKLPPGIIEKMKRWSCIYKSPYSNSFYSDNVTYESKPNGTLRVSDHWNYPSRRSGKIQSKSDQPIENQIYWAIGEFTLETKTYKILYKEHDIQYLKNQEYKKLLNDYLKNPETIALKRAFARKIESGEILVEANVYGKQFNGLLSKYTGSKVKILDTQTLDVIYSNMDIKEESDISFIFTDKFGEKVSDPYILPYEIKDFFIIN